MKNSFREEYKVKRSPVEISNEIQFGLRKNEEYDIVTDKQCQAILNFFEKCYPKVSIEIPKKRKKSLKSINEKSKNREIERLSKLYIIEGISREEIKELYKLFEKRIYEGEKLDKVLVLKNIRELLEEDIENIDIQKFLNCIMLEDEISDSTKKALLRILRGKIEKSNIPKKEQEIKYLEEKYGREAEKKSGKPEDNIMQYESIEEIRKSKERIQLLHDEINYLKSEDLMGMKIVISNIPSNIKTENKRLKKLIKLRDKSKTREEREKYDNMAMQEIAKEFINTSITDKEFLKEIESEVIPFSLKHKNKTNGYEAYHVKIRSINNPEYTLEIQSKSEYVENLSRGNGAAAHENRPGKKRIIPEAENEEEFLKKIIYMVPEYTTYIKGDKGFEAKKCNMLQNIMGYFENLIDPVSEEYDRIEKIVKGYMLNNREK